MARASLVTSAVSSGSSATATLRPWRSAFCLTRALPAAVRGPVLRRALTRLAARLRSVVTRAQRSPARRSATGVGHDMANLQRLGADGADYRQMHIPSIGLFMLKVKHKGWARSRSAAWGAARMSHGSAERL